MSDPEFDDFLARRRPLFRREPDEGLEPPPELDRIVLRQARDAIEGERPLRLFGMPRWVAPMAIAATLLLAVGVVFRATLEHEQRVPEVTVESVAAQRLDPPVPPAAPPPAGTDWRSDASRWQAEIDRLRASGEIARANAEQAEFNRQHRAMATSPDR